MQMVWIDAYAVVASMQNPFPVGDWSTKSLIGETVSEKFSIGNLHHSVASTVGCAKP